MTTKSTQTSPAVLEMTATKVENFGKTERRTVLLHERKELGMCADKAGKCKVVNEIKIANCFGQFTSLLTGITIEFPCEPSNFEAEAVGYHARVSKAIMNFQNQTLEAVGKDKMWHGTPPVNVVSAPATGGKKKSVKIGSKKAAPKKAAPRKAVTKTDNSEPPAARKRVPRKRK